MNLNACKVSVVKFIPDPIKEESINIGLIIHCYKHRYIDCKFSDVKISNIKFLYPEINIKFLENLIDDLETEFSAKSKSGMKCFSNESADPSFLDRLAVSYSNQLRISSPKGILSGDIMSEIDYLFSQYVSDEVKRQNKTVIKDITIKARLKKEFKERKILDKTIFTDAEVTGKYGEPISFDFRYQNGKPNYIHSISFDVEDKDINDAKIWLMNYIETKEVLGGNVGLTTVYCPPSEDCRLKDFSKTLNILKAGNTKLVNYNDQGQLVNFVDHVLHTAHSN